MKTKTFKSQLSTFKSRAGFTLIELLVVIGVLGIMAAALVATIDPIEQIRKAQDSNVKNAAVEYLNAMVRYYATHQYYPWDGNTSNVSSAACKGLATDNILDTTQKVYVSGSGDMNDCTTQLLNEKELKAGFVSDISNITSKIYVSQDGSTSDLSVCFLPTSKSQKVDPGTKFSQSGAAQTSTCNLDSTDCYWCAK